MNSNLDLKRIETQLKKQNQMQSEIAAVSGEIDGLVPRCFTGANGIIGTTEQILSPNIPVNSLNITFPLTAATVSIASESPLDTSTGTGARLVLVDGLDSDYNVLQEVISLNGQLPMISTGLFLRINRLVVVFAGTLLRNQADIHCSSGTETWTAGGEPTTLLYHTIQTDFNVSKTGIYTIPAGFSMVLNNTLISSTTTNTNPITTYINIQIPGSPPLKIIELFVVRNVSYKNESVSAFVEKSDIFITSSCPVSVKAHIAMCGYLMKDSVYQKTINFFTPLP